MFDERRRRNTVRSVDEREQHIIGRQLALVDAVIRPRVHPSSALDFRQIDQVPEAGAAPARLQLPEFEKRLTSAARPGR